MPHKDIEKKREANRKWGQENKEQSRESSRKYYHENKAELNAKRRKSYKDTRPSRLHKIGGFCQFDGCEIDNQYMLTVHRLFPGDKETVVILCANYHRLIDHYKEGFYNSKKGEKIDRNKKDRPDRSR